MDISNLLRKWTDATSKLEWGQQRMFTDALTLVAEGKSHLVYGADYRDGYPCLVNAVAAMSTTSGGQGIPSQYFGEVVSLFDQINRHFETVSGYNDASVRQVSPYTADILLHYFAPLKDKPIEAAVNEAVQNEAFANGSYREPKDNDLMRDWLNAMKSEAPTEPETSVGDKVETKVYGEVPDQR